MRQERIREHGARRRTATADADRAAAGPPRAAGDADTASARATTEREALMRVAAAGAGASGLDDVIELTAEAAREAIGAGCFSISRWEREHEQMRVLINVGTLAEWELRFPEDETYSLSENPVLNSLLRDAVPYFNAVDDPVAPESSVALLRALGKESDIGVPIIVDGVVWGEVWAATCPGDPRFRARDVRFLELIAGQLAAVISRAELFTSVSRMAYEDPLTGLANRRAFEERLERAVTRSRSSRGELALVLCDVDELKSINDGRGHQAGDRALRRVGEALVGASATLPGSVVGRLSGDEFAVLLDGHGLDAAREVCTGALAILRSDRDVTISLSCGAAASVGASESVERLLRAADTAQYAAKRRGGGQLCTAEAAHDEDSHAPRRRGRRRGAPERLERASARLVELLDSDLAESTTVDRLEAVMGAVAEALNAAAWTISFAAHGSAEIRSICAADDRDSRLRGIRVGLDEEVYALSDYPATAQLVGVGTGTFLIDRHDGEADAAERALLAELGYSAVLGATVSDLDGIYLAELYSDGDTAELSVAELRISLLARAAAGRSSGITERMEQLQKRTHQLSANAALGTRLTGMVEASEIVDAAVDELHREFGFPVCSIVRLTAGGSLEIAAARGPASQRLRDEGWTQPADVGLLGRALVEREIVCVGDVRREPDYRLTSETRESRSEMCAPLFAGDKPWGAIDVLHEQVNAFDDDDVRFVRMVADQVSQALLAASLYAQLEGAFRGTAEALVSALEAKDAYTALHSRSIAENAEAVGRELGLDEPTLRILRFGAAFHDIGKLAIPESILNKPGPLDPTERARIEQHTVIGDQILSPIEFLKEVRPLVRHGHERWDGDGYPDGLAGEAIPLGARIIFVCDAYDSMTTERPYRYALPSDLALTELSRCAGTQFDPRVVEALVAVLSDLTPVAA